MRREGEAPTEINPEAPIINPEAPEATPEHGAAAVLTKLENKDDQDKIISSSWIKKHKKGLAWGAAGAVAVGAVAVGVATHPEATLTLVTGFHPILLAFFVKKFIEKRGKMTFMDGYNIFAGAHKGK